MKNKTLVLVSIVCALFVIGCNQFDLSDTDVADIGMYNIPAGKGAFTLHVTGENTDGRTIMPNSFTYAVYELVFTDTDNAENIHTFFQPKGEKASIILDIGEYELKVTAYKEFNANIPSGKIAEGTSDDPIVIVEGENVEGEVTLIPFIVDDEGTGNFKWIINYPAGLYEVKMDITPADGGTTETLYLASENSLETITGDENTSAGVTTNTGELELDSGYYKILFTLIKDETDYRPVTWRETLHVYQYLDSTFRYTFTEEHFRKQSYPVKFVYGNDGVTPDITRSFFFDAVIEVPVTPVRAGYNFAYWYTDENNDGTQWNMAAPLGHQSLTLYAKWTAISYNINMESNNDGFGSASANLSEATVGERVDITATVDSGAANVIFSEWQVDSENSDLIINTLTPTTAWFIMPPRDVTITALFEQQDAPTPHLVIAPAPIIINADFGYLPGAVSVTLTNSGTGTATVASITLSGGAGSLFNIGGSTTPVIAVNGTASFTIQPKIPAKLKNPQYTETLTVTYNNGSTATANVIYNINHHGLADYIIDWIIAGSRPANTITFTDSDLISFASGTGTRGYLLKRVPGTWKMGRMVYDPTHESMLYWDPEQTDRTVAWNFSSGKAFGSYDLPGYGTFMIERYTATAPPSPFVNLGRMAKITFNFPGIEFEDIEVRITGITFDSTRHFAKWNGAYYFSVENGNQDSLKLNFNVKGGYVFEHSEPTDGISVPIFYADPDYDTIDGNSGNNEFIYWKDGDKYYWTYGEITVYEFSDMETFTIPGNIPEEGVPGEIYISPPADNFKIKTGGVPPYGYLNPNLYFKADPNGPDVFGGGSVNYSLRNWQNITRPLVIDGLQVGTVIITGTGGTIDSSDGYITSINYRVDYNFTLPGFSDFITTYTLGGATVTGNTRTGSGQGVISLNTVFNFVSAPPLP